MSRKVAQRIRFETVRERRSMQAGVHMETDGDLIAAYRLHQQRRGLQPTTIEVRTRKLRLFASWLTDGGLLAATRNDVEAFLDSRRINARSRYCWISHIGCFYKWAINEEYTQHDPTARVIRPKLPRLLPRPISDTDLDLAVRCAPRPIRTWLLLASLEGLRCHEMAQLTREDVLDTNTPPVILVHGKGAKDRLMPLHPDVAMALRMLPMPRHGRVFVKPQTHQPWSPGEVSHAINEFLHGIGIDATAHCCRHWFGTHIYEQTHDLRLTQELMGHSNPAVTAGYAAYSRGRAQEAVISLGVAAAAF